jgi:type IV pilus assembly protein PilV
MQLKHTPMRQRARGFTLVEVLVALLVISIGLLGIAKMQALALSNTNGGRLRALAAIEAASLAATMQSERNYWGTFTANQTVTVTGTPTPTPTGSATVTGNTDGTLSGTVTCLQSTGTTIGLCTGTVDCTSSGTPCTAQKMAAFDLQQWAGRLQQVLTTDAATITCSVTPNITPVACQIIINWAEGQTNSNSSETAIGMGAPSYTLFVNP